MAGFKTGFAVGAVVVAAGATWLIWKLEHQPIMFPGKSIYSGSGMVSVVGSVVGTEKREDDRPANNGFQMTCYKPDRNCKVLFADEINHNYVGQIESETLTVRKWDEQELVADSLDLASAFQGCNYYEVRVLLKSEDAIYNRIPNPKADKARCAQMFKSSKPFRQWRIDYGKGWNAYERGEG